MSSTNSQALTAFVKELTAFVNTTPSWAIRLLKPDKTYMDLNGYSFWFTVKKDTSKSLSDDSEAVLKKTWSINVSQTTIAIQLALADTAVIATRPTGLYIYDLKMKDTTGAINTVMLGNYIFCQSVTQRAI